MGLWVEVGMVRGPEWNLVGTDSGHVVRVDVELE